MEDKELNLKFQEAVATATKTDIKLAPDIKLQFYAYYKQATRGNKYENPSNPYEENVRSAFKLNAWFQLNHLSKDKAKEKYIELVNNYIINK